MRSDSALVHTYILYAYLFFEGGRGERRGFTAVPPTRSCAELFSSAQNVLLMEGRRIAKSLSPPSARPWYIVRVMHRPKCVFLHIYIM